MSGDHNEGKPARPLHRCPKVLVALTAVFGLALFLATSDKSFRGVGWRRSSPLAPSIADCTFAQDGDCDLVERQLIMSKIIAHVIEHSQAFQRPENYTDMYNQVHLLRTTREMPDQKAAPAHEPPLSTCWKGAPFPHLYIDDMFPEHILREIAPRDGRGEFPEAWVGKVSQLLQLAGISKSAADLTGTDAGDGANAGREAFGEGAL
eukprot:scaffold1044_cov266-Pinguiococcus_pyrenoidosus.AAC.6